VGVKKCDRNQMLRFGPPVGEKGNGFGTEKQYQIIARVKTAVRQ